MRLGNTTGKWNASMEEEHNQNLLPRNQSIRKEDYIAWRNSRYLRRETKEELKSIFFDAHRAFNSNDFSRKVAVTGKCVSGVYYRKISGGEYAAIQDEKQPFKKAFVYTNTDNYRYWMSSSFGKVQAFGNDNSTDTSSIILRFEFTSDLRKAAEFDIRPHQAAGVQTNKQLVALHREGFAEFGNIDNALQVQEIVEENLDHNLGFTNVQEAQLAAFLKQWSVVIA